MTDVTLGKSHERLSPRLPFPVVLDRTRGSCTEWSVWRILVPKLTDRPTWGVCVDHSPTVRGRRLMRELKRLRETSGMSPDEAARRLDFSKSKLYRLENGRSRVDADDLEDMLDLYDVRSPERDAYIQLGRDSRRRGWWTTYKDVFTGSYVGLEFEAARIQMVSHLVPGIFQTPDYARAVITGTRPAFALDEIERRVAARIARQAAILDRDNPPDIHIILDEAALHRVVGGADVLQQQLAGLAKACTRPGVTIQVLPFAAGASAALEGDFVILAFPDPEDQPVAYAEGLFGDLYLESKEELDRYSLAWTHLLTKALSPADSTAVISELSETTEGIP
jgi:transcriptional regulator with XRE-family HTH domain